MSDAQPAPRVLKEGEHRISRRDLDVDAVKVLHRLEDAGYESYLVGGGVRDLLLGRVPKDYDIATAARPEQVRRLFRNSRIIGRRFRLVHVYFHGGIVEVATFRAAPDPDAQRGGPDDLLVTDDNVFGNPREDAFRRDFTINALLYRLSDGTVVDYVGGVEDLEAQCLRVIGDPDTRFHEDPVRMMRACEMAGRLGFSIELSAQRSIEEHYGELAKAASARLVEEVLALLKCGAAGPSAQWMFEFGLLDDFLPEIVSMHEAERAGLGRFGGVLGVLDRRISDGWRPEDAVLVASMLAPHLLWRRHQIEQRRGGRLSKKRLERLAEKTVVDFSTRLAFPNAKTRQTHAALSVFLRLCEQVGDERAVHKVARRRGFHDGLDVFSVLVEATDEGQSALEVWQRVAKEHGPDRPPRRAQGGHTRKRSRKRPRPKGRRLRRSVGSKRGS